MFGFEDKKKKKPMLVFDLEKDIEDPKKQAQLMKTTEKHIADLKHILTKGSSAQHFENLGHLLQGYSSLLKVLNRINPN